MSALPLDQLQITHKDLKTGKPRTSPALHPEQKADRYFVLYKPPPKDNIPALVEEYLERATFVANDLDWLLALPHDKFWCQVVFDETLQKCLDSYLRYVPRKFDEWVAPTPEVADMQKHLHRSIFLTFLRMSTHKESKDHFISPSAFGEILYNNFLFDIPKILDLCVLFGKGNSPLLQKMIGNIFTQQPSYYNDLDETIPTILQVFSNILQHCGLQGDGTSTTPQKLGEKGRLTPSDMPLLELKDIVLYLCDTCTTLWAFLDIFPLACQTFQKHDFCYSSPSKHRWPLREEALEDFFLQETWKQKSPHSSWSMGKKGLHFGSDSAFDSRLTCSWPSLFQPVLKARKSFASCTHTRTQAQFPQLWVGVTWPSQNSFLHFPFPSTHPVCSLCS